MKANSNTEVNAPMVLIVNRRRNFPRAANSLIILDNNKEIKVKSLKDKGCVHKRKSAVKV